MLELEKTIFPLHWDAVLGEARFIREKLGGDYDFVFIYGKNFCKKYSRLLSQVRLNFPLSDLFIVTAEKDYNMALGGPANGGEGCDLFSGAWTGAFFDASEGPGLPEGPQIFKTRLADYGYPQLFW